MTETIEIAVAEILRCGVWALRGLGMRYGVAERAAPWLAWAEAVEGGALAALRAHTDGLTATSGNPLRRAEAAARHWRIDAAGKSLLEVGPVAIDLLTLAARTGGAGTVEIEGVVDPLFASAICRLALRRGLSIEAAADAGLRLAGVAVGAIRAWPDGSGGAAFAAADPADDPAGTAPPGLRLSTPCGQTRPEHPPVDVDARFRSAQQRNIIVSKRDLDHLYALEVRTWAPTSERSRKQALV